jgi:hypothetical protein
MMCLCRASRFFRGRFCLISHHRQQNTRSSILPVLDDDSFVDGLLLDNTPEATFFIGTRSHRIVGDFAS